MKASESAIGRSALLGRSALVLLWALSVATGFLLLARIETTPSARGATPASIGLDVRSGGSTEAMLFVHPKCPCTLASLHLFEKLATHVASDVHFTVWFVRPKGVKPGWERTSMWTAATRIANVQVKVDVGGERSRKVGALTSGHLIICNSTGRLLFSGGITASRGMEEACRAEELADQVIHGKVTTPVTTPVYGCVLTP